MLGQEKEALRTEKELRHKPTASVEIADELLDKWRAEQQRLKELLITHDDTDWAYPLPAQPITPAPAPAPAPVVTKAASNQPTGAAGAKPKSWSQMAASGPSAPARSTSQEASPPPTLKPDNVKRPLTLVGGVDLSFFRDDKRTAIAALVVCSFPKLEVVYEVYKVVELTTPYVPGYLAFREVPALVSLVEHVRRSKPQFVPQVILVDGNGVLHYGGFGSACHLGVLAGIPTLGVAKKLLCVDGLSTEVDVDRWLDQCEHYGRDWVEIVGRSGQVHGAMIRPQSRTVVARSRGGSADAPTPLFVSLGHRVSLQTAVEITLACIRRTMPEPIDQADLRSREHVRKLYQECQRKGEQRPAYGLTLEKVHQAPASSTGSRTPPTSKGSATSARGTGSVSTNKPRNARLPRQK